MSLRVGFDVDGVVADFHAAFRTTAEEVGHGAPSAGTPGGALDAAAIKRVWDHIAHTPQWWLTLGAYEPDQLPRLYKLSRERRWEVYFLTTRPSSAGETTQFQTQWWLEQNGFPMPSVVTVPGSRGDAANSIRLDIVIDDRLTNCVDIIAASRAKAIMLMRKDDPAAQSQALARGIGVVPTLTEAIDAIEEYEVARKAHAGKLSRLADWFKPGKQHDAPLPLDARAALGPIPPPKAR